MTSKLAKRWVVRMLLIIGVVLALAAAAPEANASFRLSIGTGGFYFSVGHHDYYPYYNQPARYGGYAATSFSFRNTLNDYGYWQYSPEMGMDVWIPYVEYGWRPYTYGHWTYSPYGWTWVAYEPWGWIPHHYGNWAYVDHYGWAWVPGYTWRPHCVNFAMFDGYIGWAPVAPPWYRYSYNRDYHYRGGRGRYSGWHHGQRSHGYSGIDYNAYVFVDNRHFYGTGIHRHALLPGRGAEMFRAGQVMPLGDSLELDYVKRVTGRSITPVSLDRQVYKVNGSEVVHYQPRGQEQLVRQSALTTVNKALAPGFQKNGVSFKGSSAQSAGKVDSLFKQERKAPKTASFTQAAVSKDMTNDAYYQKQKQTLDNLARTRVSTSASSGKGQSKMVGRTSSAKTSTSGSAGSKQKSAVTSGRSNGYKPRTGATVSGGGNSSASSRSGSMSRGSSSKGRTQAVTSGSTSRKRGQAVNSGSSTRGRAGSMDRAPSTSGRSRSTSRTAGSVPKRTRTVSKPPARTRTSSRPSQGKSSRPSGTSTTRSVPPRGKPEGKPAGKPAGKPSGSSSKGKSSEKGKSGKRG